MSQMEHARMQMQAYVRNEYSVRRRHTMHEFIELLFHGPSVSS